MSFMITPSNYDKSDICQFFYQDLFHIASKVYVKNFMLNEQKLLKDFQKSPVQVRLSLLFIFTSDTRRGI